MSTEEMERELGNRDLSMKVFRSEASGVQPWVVWLFAKDDPGLGVISVEGRSIEEAFHEALDAWDGGQAEEAREN